MVNDARGAYLAVGVIVGAHGIRGEVKVEILTDFPDRFTVGARLILDHLYLPLEVAGARPHKAHLLLRFVGIDTRSEVEVWAGLHLLVPRSDARTLPEGEFYEDELVGLEVVTEDGVVLGRVREVFWAPANEIYVVEGEYGEVLLPAIADVIRVIDLQAGRIVIHLLTGLVEGLDPVWRS